MKYGKTVKYGKLFDIRTRKWIYNIAIAVIALLVGYGIMTQEIAALWLALAGAVIGVARTNTGVSGIMPRRAVDDE